MYTGRWKIIKNDCGCIIWQWNGQKKAVSSMKESKSRFMFSNTEKSSKRFLKEHIKINDIYNLKQTFLKDEKRK